MLPMGNSKRRSMQVMTASGAQPLDNLMTPDNPPLVPSLLSNLKS